MITWLLNEGGGFKSKINTCIDSNGREGLLLAVLNQAYSNVELLLENGANLYIKDNAGWGAMECPNQRYGDGADYMRLRDPPGDVIQIKRLLTEPENQRK